jgi:hypothetical protein
MNIEHFILNLEKRSDKYGLNFKVENPASELAIGAFEKRIGTKIPEQVKWFYQKCNGLKVEAPPLEIKSIESLEVDEKGKIVFAIFDKRHRICFDASKTNTAKQWDISNYDTGFIVTFTMASFWANKIFAWLDKKRTIWKEETF